MGPENQNPTVFGPIHYGDRGQVTQLGTAAVTNFGVGNTDRTSSGVVSFENGALGMMRRSGNSTSDHRYTRTADGQAIGHQLIDGVRAYYVHDHLGSVVGIFDAQGVYRGGFSYSPTGESRGVAQDPFVINTHIRYIGQ